MELKAALERLVQDPESSENAEIAFSSMKVLGKSDDEIAAFYDKFQYSWAVVDKYADVLISEGKTEKAIAVIQAYRNEYHEYEIRISEKLLGIYREQKAFNKLSESDWSNIVSLLKEKNKFKAVAELKRIFNQDLSLKDAKFFIDDFYLIISND